VTAAPGDTVESLAARMIVANRPVERFLVLNGLERSAQVKPGESYKIIVE
jgi:predicted Zn-dependent protease